MELRPPREVAAKLERRGRRARPSFNDARFCCFRFSAVSAMRRAVASPRFSSPVQSRIRMTGISGITRSIRSSFRQTVREREVGRAYLRYVMNVRTQTCLLIFLILFFSYVIIFNKI